MSNFFEQELYSLFYLKDQDQFLFLDEPREGYLYFQNYRLNLLTGKREIQSIEELEKQMQLITMAASVTRPRVFHLFYEYGLVLKGQEVPSETPLAIYIDYANSQINDFSFFKFKKNQTIGLSEINDYKSQDYEEQFREVHENLFRGNCYQVNLTYRKSFEWVKPKRTPQIFLGKLFSHEKKRGAYAHATYSRVLGKLFLSNSPECLFQYDPQKQEVFSMPIKGTRKLKSQKEFKKVWSSMNRSQKEQAELFMITDLIRNDLSFLNDFSSRVVHEKQPLAVPGILHQYSLITTKVEKQLSLFETIEALFPGGSITGAPKKRVMELIKNIEKNKRGFYCGSTILLIGAHKSASINIRSCTIDFVSKKLEYGTGGGVTLLSKLSCEFEESKLKLSSFIKLLN